MPFVSIDNTRMFYRLEGSDDRPVLVLSHSLGCDHGQWDIQTRDLLPYFRILRYDTRGHGASDVTPGDYSIELLGRDVMAIAAALGIDKFAFCGLSMGGMIGQWLASSAPERVTHLVLANTSPRMDSAALETRRRAVLEGGMAAVSDAVLGRFFSPETLARQDADVASTRRTLLNTDPRGYAGCCGAIRDMDQTGLAAKVRVPTLIIVGDRDVSTPWSGHGEVLARTISNARVVHLPTAHLSNLERPRSFSSALTDFLIPSSSDTLEAGFKVRREMLGDAYVDAAVAKTTEFTREFQELITRYAWGTIWTRPGIPRRTRRLLALTIMATLGRWEEFRIYVRAGLEHELEPCDLKEVLLQAAVYAGVPVGNTGFKIASEEIEKACAPKSG
ncbi:MAG TPA: 3-oxoadipate enol-lactonase [Bryobacteraceae bacterium]|nr:3-oxoadipate enol-lactonase [Bryobacteraceae bacterium]